ncbi:hypothetical protein Bca4012_015925 [Brassica carinata]
MELGTSVYRPNAAVYDSPDGVEVRGRYDQVFAKILTRDALEFVAELQREFRGHVRYAMECWREAKRRYNSGGVPGFDPSTKFIRDGEWFCASVPPAVTDRRADFEDALSPSWENLMKGQVNLKDAVDGSITFHDKSRNRVYKLTDQPLDVSSDFGLYFFHNYAKFRETQGSGSGPFSYLPKMEHSSGVGRVVVEEKMERIEKEVGRDKFKRGMYKEASKMFTKQCTAEELDDFLTI